MGVALKEYSQEELAAQPIGSWTGEAYRHVVGALRAQLAVEGLTQPHWWTLNHVAGEPGRWTRAALVERGERNARVHRQMHEGVDTADFVTTINVLRRIVANLGGDGNLPD